ncbi:MAG: DNA topology modulation protein [Gemmatimonadetes bacterium]|nr:DNA topology modulation protein [Gemmatimonadota bacterium]
MRRVIVIGSGGAGKSTLATRLGEITGLPVHHLDAFYWRPGWVESPPEEWSRTIAALAAEPVWIMDGNYSRTLDQRLAACDTAIFLDLPRTLCIARVIRRRLRYRGRSRPDMAPDCPEQVPPEFLRWIWRYPIDRRPAVLRRLAEVSHEKRVVHLRSSREVERFLDEVRLGAR